VRSCSRSGQLPDKQALYHREGDKANDVERVARSPAPGQGYRRHTRSSRCTWSQSISNPAAESVMPFPGPLGIACSVGVSLA